MPPLPTRPAPPRRSAAPFWIMIGLAAVISGSLLAAVAVRLRARGEEGPPTELLGSALPEGWQPGTGGAGQPPPPPPGAPPPPVGEPVAPTAPQGTAGGNEEPFGQLRRQEGVPLPEGPAGPSPPPEMLPPPEPDSEEPVVAYVPPRLIAMPSPLYPRAGRRRGMEATVVVRVRVTDDGGVAEAEAVGERVGFGFEEAALRSARRARFHPATRGGVPVTADTRIAVRFQLEG